MQALIHKGTDAEDQTQRHDGTRDRYLSMGDDEDVPSQRFLCEFLLQNKQRINEAANCNPNIVLSLPGQMPLKARLMAAYLLDCPMQYGSCRTRRKISVKRGNLKHGVETVLRQDAQHSGSRHTTFRTSLVWISKKCVAVAQ